MNSLLPAGCVIAVLGAESTGKTALVDAIVERLRAHGHVTARADESLREWCDREGRTPRPEEQAAIAAEQTRRIALAAVHGVVVADTTALMTAVYSDLIFADTTLYLAALAAQHACTITLLTALDLPGVAGGLQRSGSHGREAVDRKIRDALTGAGLPFSVVHGRGEQRLANAWHAIESIATRAVGTGAGGRFDLKNPRWVWDCEKCSDPECEHRMFSDLLGQRP